MIFVRQVLTMVHATVATNAKNVEAQQVVYALSDMVFAAFVSTNRAITYPTIRHLMEFCFQLI